MRLDDDELPPEQRYRLVVTASDVTAGQLVRLPWDYRRVYGLDPDEQPVADAVRASMSIPFFFRPVTLTSSTGRESTLVDGGLLSNYPIDSLDRCDGKKPPVADARGGDAAARPTRTQRQGDSRAGAAAAVRRPESARGRHHHDPCRPRPGVPQPAVGECQDHPGRFEEGRVLDFDIKQPQIDALYAEGYDAATTFLSTWDERAYVERFRT